MHFCTYITWALWIWWFCRPLNPSWNSFSLGLSGTFTWFSPLLLLSFIISFLGSSSYLASLELLLHQSSVPVLNSCGWFYQCSCPWLPLTCGWLPDPHFQSRTLFNTRSLHRAICWAFHLDDPKASVADLLIVTPQIPPPVYSPIFPLIMQF